MAARSAARWLALAAALAAAPAAAQSPEGPPEPPLQYDVTLQVSRTTGEVAGTLQLRWRVPPGAARTTLPLVTYANLYRTPNPRLTDVTYPWCFPRDFDGGAMELGRITTAQGEVCPIEPHPDLRWPEGTVWQVQLPAPAAAGSVVHLTVPFTAQVPHRFGAFGRRLGTLTANGGLTPHLPALDSAGRPLAALPPRALWRVAISGKAAGAVLLNGRHWEAGIETSVVELPATRWLTLVQAPALHRYHAAGGGAEVVYYRLTPDEQIGNAVAQEALVALRWGRALTGGGPQHMVLCEARLRDVFTRPGAGCVLVSDRALRVFPMLGKYHVKEIAGAMFVQLAEAVAGTAERPADLPWTAEAAAWWLRARYQAGRDADYREVRTVIDFLSFLPIVDQVRVAPRFPFSDLYFDAPFRVDPLREDITTFAHGTPEGRELAARLDDLLGPARASAVWQRYLGFGTHRPAGRPLADVAAAQGGPAVAAILDTWRRPRMPVNYRPGTIAPAAPGHARIHVAREGGAPGLREPVPVQLQLEDGTRRNATVVAGNAGGTADVAVPSPVRHLRIDPLGRMRETNRGDNSTAWSLQPLISVPRVNIDPNRGRYEIFARASLVANGDYRNRLTLGGFIEQEGRGLSLGYFRGEGWKRDTTDYPLTFGAAIFLEDLDRNFASTRSGRLNDDGVVASVRLSADLDLRFEPRNPHWGLTAFVTAEWADAWFGTEFRFQLAEAGVAFTIPLIREQIVGGQLRLGVSEGLLPTQRLFDAGGEEGVRGLRAGDLLGEHRWLFRLEYRHTLLTEIQEWLPSLPGELFTPRRLQGVAFADMGNVTDDFENLLDTEDALLSVGYGLRIYLDFLGARYSMVRFELAYRLDDLDEARVLFYVGASHSF